METRLLLTDRERVRIGCIDAAEVGRPGAESATQKLRSLVVGRNVGIRRITRDRYQRTVAELYVGGQRRRGVGEDWSRWNLLALCPSVQLDALTLGKLCSTLVNSMRSNFEPSELSSGIRWESLRAEFYSRLGRHHEADIARTRLEFYKSKLADYDANINPIP